MRPANGQSSPYLDKSTTKPNASSTTSNNSLGLSIDISGTRREVDLPAAPPSPSTLHSPATPARQERKPRDSNQGPKPHRNHKRKIVHYSVEPQRPIARHSFESVGEKGWPTTRRAERTKKGPRASARFRGGSRVACPRWDGRSPAGPAIVRLKEIGRCDIRRTASPEASQEPATSSGPGWWLRLVRKTSRRGSRQAGFMTRRKPTPLGIVSFKQGSNILPSGVGLHSGVLDGSATPPPPATA